MITSTRDINMLYYTQNLRLKTHETSALSAADGLSERKTADLRSCRLLRNGCFLHRRRSHTCWMAADEVNRATDGRCSERWHLVVARTAVDRRVTSCRRRRPDGGPTLTDVAITTTPIIVKNCVSREIKYNYDNTSSMRLQKTDSCNWYP